MHTEQNLQDNPIQKPKRRRSSNSRLSNGGHRRNQNRRSLNPNYENKENHFTSTPIKSPDECFHAEALRDVSNITPKDTKVPIKILTPNQKKQFSPKYVKHKKKKRCLDPTHVNPTFSFGIPNYVNTIEALNEKCDIVDNCGCKIFGDKSSTPKHKIEAFAPTLPTFGVEYSPCGLRPTPNLLTLRNNDANRVLSHITSREFDHPFKKPKVDHVNDFLHQISYIAPSEDKRIDNYNNMALKMSPLVQKLVGLRFTPIKTTEKANDSSFINNLSLNDLVNAILDSSAENNNKNPIINANEVQCNKRDYESFSDRNSTDSGFRSNTDSHNIEANFLCKCQDRSLKTEVPALSCDKTIINIDETFNERCVDDDISTRKRSLRAITDNDWQSKGFTLKRQKCIRRRRLIDEVKKISDDNHSPTNSVYWELDANWNDNSFESSYCGRSDETKSSSRNTEYENYISDDGDNMRRTRRCLMFDSPASDTSSISSNKQPVSGSMELEIDYCPNELVVKILRCHDLLRSKVNAYIKVCLSDGRRKEQGTLQRTPVQAESCKPTFNHTFRLPLRKSDLQKRLFIEVWHRDRICRSSKFLGCMSFSIKNVIKKSIKGHFCLLPQSTGRCQNVPMTTDQISNVSTDSRTFLQQTDSYGQQNDVPIGNKTAMMCESQSSVEEVVMSAPDDIDGDLKKSAIVNKTVLSEQQKLADENLFLRYLELDPTEGPEAIPAALQRKATGNKNGRTPFTTTKKLNRQPKTGFGFSVVWTHPPRVERVEKGLPADRAGILPGDYIIFVDKHNVVMMPEIEILNLIRSYGNQLTLEIFRRNTSRNGSVSNVRRLPSIGTESSTTVPAPSLTTQRRPSTVCSTTNTTSMEYNRRKLQLPQVTFSAEKPSNSSEDARKKAMYQLISKEQQYATGLQFAVTRFVSSLAERKDLITAKEHKLLFQNSEELLRISEDIIDVVIPEDGDPQFHLLGIAYHAKLSEIIMAYRKYCSGIKKSDCILANKMKNSNSEFVRFLQCPAIPRRRPDITAFIHKPLEHFRDVLKLFSVILSNTKSNAEDYPVISQIVHDLQITYREITAEGGLMEPLGEGRPLLSVQDLENRLVFTKCKPFVLSKPGRQWIFGGDLSRVEGRNVRQYWALLFTDILLFAKVSRDRVLFIFEDPLSLAHITDITFNIRKKVNEFRITVEPGGKTASSPTIHCGPDLTRTPRKNPNRRCIVLRAPTMELKAVWQNLLQRQIFHVNAGMDGSSFSSPLESPEAPITSSVATLQSAESLSIRRQVRLSIGRCSEPIDNSSTQFTTTATTNTTTTIAQHHFNNENHQITTTTTYNHHHDELYLYYHKQCTTTTTTATTNNVKLNSSLSSLNITPDTPSANITPTHSCPDNSLAFTSHFTSESSLFQKSYLPEEPGSPSPILTPTSDSSYSDDGRYSEEIDFLRFDGDLTSFEYELDSLSIEEYLRNS
ncbi:PsGEF [Trypoxylus dichotomus]